MTNDYNIITIAISSQSTNTNYFHCYKNSSFIPHRHQIRNHRPEPLTRTNQPFAEICSTYERKEERKQYGVVMVIKLRINKKMRKVGMGRRRESNTYKHTGNQVDRHTDRWTHTQSDRQSDRHTLRDTNNQTDRQSGRQTHGQMDSNPFTQNPNKICARTKINSTYFIDYFFVCYSYRASACHVNF